MVCGALRGWLWGLSAPVEKVGTHGGTWGSRGGWGPVEMWGTHRERDSEGEFGARVGGVRRCGVGFGLLWGCGALWGVGAQMGDVGRCGVISPMGRGLTVLLRRWAGAMDDLRLHYRFLSWRRRIREIREVRAVRYQERAKHVLVDGDTLRWGGGRWGVGCEVT